MQTKITLYYMNGCGPCSNYLPIWREMKPKFLKNVKSNEVEISSLSKEESNKLKIVKAPTVIVEHNDKTYHLDEQKYNRTDIDDLNKFIKNIQTSVIKEQTGGKNNYFEKYKQYKYKYLKLKNKYNRLTKLN
jgi:hypothetical protein